MGSTAPDQPLVDQPLVGLTIRTEPLPVRWQEIFSLAAIVAVADVTLYRAAGFAGPAVAALALPLLLIVGVTRPRLGPDMGWNALLLVAVSLRLLWCGGPLAVMSALVLMTMFAMTLTGSRPFLGRIAGFLVRTAGWGVRGAAEYVCLAFGALPGGWARRIRRPAAFAMPAMAVAAFGGLFLLANPALIRHVREALIAVQEQLRIWLQNLSVLEVLFCGVVGWLTIGVLRCRGPVEAGVLEDEHATPANAPLDDDIYQGYRNTLAAVATTFGAYLLFECVTIWVRGTPEAGFDYAGYAHEGAFWLTVALALSTGVLCLIFRGSTLIDARLPTLRRWGAIWAVQNVVLALAVFYRLWLYVDFNGLTRLRVVGALGTAAVAAGLLLTLIKIRSNRSAAWLLRRQMWALGVAVLLYVLPPVDRWVTQYNVSRLMAGRSAPAVYANQVGNSTEGLLMLAPLLDAPDPEVRQLTALRLAEKRASLRSAGEHWSAWQLADRRFERQLSALAPRLPAAPE
ncbi:MAG: DUF4173 domain-containing protein [Planctomyces sp.]|nr:DUF4173 domain-containing protein [Planctomyces sp.]